MTSARVLRFRRRRPRGSGSDLAARPARAADDPVAAARLKRFNDLKFGMFIHWGPYSLASVEASWPIMTPPKSGGITEAEYRALPSGSTR